DLWHVIAGTGIVSVATALAFAAMPMLIMSSVPVHETAAANGLNQLARSIGTSTASALIGLIFSVMVIGGTHHPTREGLQLVYWIAAGAGLMTIALALLIPRPRHRLADRSAAADSPCPQARD